ncbi:Thiol-disulfide oxidoreductase ResA [Novipirellula aureliae]|uniref:Thiol-disulfide oxidoreductase ResA n=1 Tax=Novipirellula aureliae TaxID=2527966 RepID=A0A5C6DZG4_9BACT|nr:TlpA disulfide reductase family protein [Novipirellula aureliae]TWU40289.1 Thiol-disulfide oxidoreductase ResA [Novipirellula aureliae]
MSTSTYNTIAALLAIGVLIAFVVMVISLIAMIVRWKTPKRRGHGVRLLVSLIAIPCLIGIQQGILWLVFLPALGREQMAEINAARAEKLAETSVVQVGDTAPPFTLTTVNGDEFSLPDHGSVILINFFATWCGPCQIELPHLEQIWTANRNNTRFRILVIGREETMEAVRDYRKKNDFSFPIAADPDRSVYSLFANETIPRTLVVSPDGQIIYSKAGFMEEDLGELNAVLEKQLANLR